MKVQLKEYEIKMFDEFARDGSYDVLSEESYKLIFSFLDLKNIKLSGKVLEAVCGTGAFGKRFLSNYTQINVIGVDISRLMVEKANDGTKNYGALEGDLENNNLFSSMEFDHIICPFILHHFPDISTVVKNFSFWIKTDGYIIIIEPNGNNPVSKLSKFIRKALEFFGGTKYIVNKRWATPNETDHTISKYKKVFTSNGFEIVYIKSFFMELKNASCFIEKVKVFLYSLLRKLFSEALFSGTSIVAIFRKK